MVKPRIIKQLSGVDVEPFVKQKNNHQYNHMKSINLSFCVCILAFVSISFFSSCKHETDQMALMPTISYSNDIVPILNGKCGSCHGSGSSKHGFRFTTYSEFMNYVSSGNPNSSNVYSAITSKWQTMPPSPNSPVDEAARLKIYVWIKQGALNN